MENGHLPSYKFLEEYMYSPDCELLTQRANFCGWLIQLDCSGQAEETMGGEPEEKGI